MVKKSAFSLLFWMIAFSWMGCAGSLDVDPLVSETQVIQEGFTVGGQVTGLEAGETVTLEGLAPPGVRNEVLVEGVNPRFTMPVRFRAGRRSLLKIISSSPSKRCVLTKPAGVVTSDISDADVACLPREVGTCAPGSAELWVPHGPVLTMTCYNDSLFVGGDFRIVGPRTGSGVTIDANGDTPKALFDRIEGAVTAAVSDGKGGWFIGGQFKKVGDVSRYHLAHLFPDLTVDMNWQSDTNGPVSALALDSSGNLYVGGSFTTVNAQTRNHLAKLSAATGAVDPLWDPNADAPVYALLLAHDGTLYVGGDFITIKGNQIDGQPRYRIAKLTTAVTGTAVLDSWNPEVSGGAVYALALDANGYLYLGGSFTMVGTDTRNGLAKLSTSALGSVALQSWAPSAFGGEVHALALDGNGSLYVGGTFSSINADSNSSGPYLEKLSADTGSLDMTWNPTLTTVTSGAVHSLSLDGQGNLYVGGSFTKVNDLPRNNVAKLSATTVGAVDVMWSPLVGGSVLVLTPVSDGSGVLYVGGDFGSIGGVSRGNLFKHNVAGTGTVDATWVPDADAAVLALTADVSGNIYVGGTFTFVGPTYKKYIAKLNAIDGSVASIWDANPSDYVTALATDTSGNIYVAGNFELIGGQSRVRIAKLKASLANEPAIVDSAWIANENFSENYSALATDSSGYVYVGGTFTTIAGISRTNLARLTTSVSDGSAVVDTTWTPIMSMAVLALTVNTDGSIFVAGLTGIIKINSDLSTGTPWSSPVVSPVSALVRGGSSYLYAAVPEVFQGIVCMDSSRGLVF